MKRKGYSPALVVGLAGLFAMEVANGGALYVETFGSANSACSRANPCDSVAHAVSLAGKGSRIIVGPGIYSGSLSIDHPAIKLISVAGSRATTLYTGADSAALTIQPGADRSLIGQRGKGFEFAGAFNGADGIVVNASRARIEGNAIHGNAVSGDALVVNAAGATIRGNTIYAFGRGIHLPGNIDRARHKVDGNEIIGPGAECIFLQAGASGSNRLRNNVLESCGGAAIVVEALPATSKTGDRVENNVIDLGGGQGIRAIGGNPLLRRNFIDVFGVEGIRVEETSAAKIMDNLVDNAMVAFYLGAGNDRLVLTNNTVAAAEYGIAVAAGALPPRQVMRNNFFSTGTCAFDFASGFVPAAYSFSRNFWGDLAHNHPHSDCDAEADILLTGGALQLSPAAAPNPVRYRGGL